MYITRLSSAGIGGRFWEIVQKAGHPRAQHRALVVKRFIRALGQDICESCVGELDSGLEAIGPLELRSFHAVVFVYEKAATYLVWTNLPHALTCC